MKSRRKLLFPILMVLAFGVAFFALPFMLRRPLKIVNVTHADASLQTAAKKAQDQLGVFIARLQTQKPGQRFALQAKFKGKLGPEYLWCKNPTYDGLAFTATIDQDPVSADLKKGDKVSIFREDVYDWLIQNADGTKEGNFVANSFFK